MLAKSTTPIKTIRPPSSQSGGLTPLGPEQDVPLLSHLSDTQTLESTKVENTLKSTEVDSFLENMFSRQDNLPSLTDQARDQLLRLQEAVKTQNGELIQTEIAHFQSDGTVQDDLQKAMLKMKEYDAILKLRTAAARVLKMDRIARESQLGTPVSSTPLSYHNTLSDDEDDQLELKSWHSAEPHTFITEPALTTREKVGRQKLDAPKSVLKETTGYKQGDFIARNKALGVNARFYDALTQEESQRINQILEMEDLFEEDDVSDTASTHSVRPLTTMTQGFMPTGEELTKLQEIDTRLSELIPQNEWDRKSLIWSPETASGLQTPITCWDRSNLSSSKTFRSTSRDVNQVMIDTRISTSEKMYLDEKPTIEKIDSQLELLKEEDNMATREEIDKLLMGLKEQIVQDLT
ncbi:FSIP1 family-domain-containing protein [Gorgonomyces haynaldii]|nr:FSIP1 family-domain-containing protein [Gorgonomyces haynaldii]